MIRLKQYIDLTEASMTIDQIVKLLTQKIKGVSVYPLSGKSARVDITKNSVDERKRVTQLVLSTIKNARADDKTRPFDVSTPEGFKILVKPQKNAPKQGSGAYYGILEKIDLSSFNLTSFYEVSPQFAQGKLVGNIKEASDVKCVSDLNEAIEKSSKTMGGITLSIEGYTFKNVIGCIPVTNGEPKADVVFVCRKDNTLYPDCYMSYKMGNSAKGFQNYSGLSEKSSPYIFNHEETYEFYKMLSNMTENGVKKDVYQIIKDKKIIGMSVWGMGYGGAYGINNCHFIAQGEVSISGTSLKYTHSHKNGDFNFKKEYQPVFGARYATGRNNKGPKGLFNSNFRIGIFPRAYRSAWLT